MQPPRVNPYEAPQTLPKAGIDRPVHLPQNISHTKSTVAEGLSILLWLALVVLILGLLLLVILPRHWPGPDEIWGVVFGGTLLTLIVAVVLWYAFQNIRAGGVFECHMNERELSCVSPIGGTEENFTLAIADITQIEMVKGHETNRRWYVWDKQGQRYLLTQNYGNPVLDIIEELQLRRPELQIVER